MRPHLDAIGNLGAGKQAAWREAAEFGQRVSVYVEQVLRGQNRRISRHLSARLARSRHPVDAARAGHALTCSRRAALSTFSHHSRQTGHHRQLHCLQRPFMRLRMRLSECTPASLQLLVRSADVGSSPATSPNQAAHVASWNSSPLLRNSIATCRVQQRLSCAVSHGNNAPSAAVPAARLLLCLGVYRAGMLPECVSIL